MQLPHVVTLDLSQNHIENLASVKAPEMTTLRMSHNHVADFDNLSFMLNLRLLQLDHCHLVRLSAHIKKLKNLTKLDVSYNTIISLALPSRDALVSKLAQAQAKAAEKAAKMAGGAANAAAGNVNGTVMIPARLGACARAPTRCVFAIVMPDSARCFCNHFCRSSFCNRDR